MDISVSSYSSDVVFIMAGTGIPHSAKIGNIVVLDGNRETSAV